MADDFAHHALTTSHDFYALLVLNPTASPAEIRSAYRRATLKYHPDKVGTSDPATLERWHLLQIAHEVLSDPTVRELYDNARRAKEEKRVREDAFEGRRKWMKEDLERREQGASKRKREDADAEEAFERELRRIAEDGKRRRKAKEDERRREVLDAEEAAQGEQQRASEKEGGRHAAPPTTTTSSDHAAGTPDLERTITLRFPRTASTAHVTEQHLTTLFSRFGNLEAVVLRETKVKVAGVKHRQPYVSAVLVYTNIEGVRAALSSIPALQDSDLDVETWGLFEDVTCAAQRGAEASQSVPPPQPQPPSSTATSAAHSVPNFTLGTRTEGAHLKTGAPSSTVPQGGQADDAMLLRLKRAQEKRAAAASVTATTAALTAAETVG